jgi:hypothetical protein
MPANAISDLEAELDAFEPDEDLSRLLLFRILAIEFPHRVAGGRTPEQAAADMRHYLTALDLAESLSLGKIDLRAVQQLHGVLDGRSGPTPFRKIPVAVRPNFPGAAVRLTGTTPSDVVPRMEEMLEGIYRNPALKRFERIALGYFELIRTHPFEDGNGRLSRLLLTALIDHEFRSNVPLTITRVMRSDFRRYHAAIRSQDENVYARWLAYVTGAVTAELHAAGRFSVAFRNLSSNDRSLALGKIRETTGAFRDGGGSEVLLQSASSRLSAESARLLVGLMA